MSAVERIYIIQRSDYGKKLSRALPEAAEWYLSHIAEHGHKDGFEIRTTIESLSCDLPEDTEWLERELGMGPEDNGID